MPQTAPTPGWLEAYRSGRLREFHRLPPGDLDGALATKHPAGRGALAAALETYLRRLGTPPAALESAARLAHPRSRVVVAGQQAGLLGGPAFSFYKAADAISLARRLDREDAPVVPVFWVASQDHDAAEVATTFLLDFSEEQHRLELPLPSGRPVGRLPLAPEWVERTVDALRAFRGPDEWRTWVIGEVERSAGSARSYADWFAALVSNLLGPHGLVAFDPLEPELAALFQPALLRELENPLAGPAAIEEAGRRLEGLGFAPQLRRPAGATNLFLEGEDGERRLLRFDGRLYHAERAYSRADLAAIAQAEPGRLSPAAGLRPAFQDAVLPTAASVLGPGELAYQLQLGGVYEHLGVAQPLLWPRMSVTWLEAPARRLLTRFGLTPAEYMADPRGALERRLLEASGAAIAFESGLTELTVAFERLASRVEPLDPGLAGALARSRSRVLGHVERLERKTAAALARSEAQAENGAVRLEKHLAPGGVPQERHYTFLTYLLKYGPEPLERLMGLEPGGRYFLEI